mmetsp:Transcript_54/g.164  ORF Transcript_54/g.164 Transcript_54/m.164 type:complete len:447 (-) Transcript_54:244-1584(-)
MYGGDEVSAVVVDVGYSNCKAGFAGEDNPKAVFPSHIGVCSGAKDGNVGQRAAAQGEKMDVDQPSSAPPPAAGEGGAQYAIGTNALCYRKDGMEIEHPIEDGIVKNWDLMEKLWDHGFRDRLRISPEEHPMLLAEPSFNTNAAREKMIELMFEKYKVPAVFVAKNAVLTAFSCGRSTAVVLDSGGGSTCVSPVHDGYVLQRAVVKSHFSGERLTQYLLNTIESKGANVRPAYQVQKKVGKDGALVKVTDVPGIEGTTESYRKYMQSLVVNDIKEVACRTSETVLDETASQQVPFTQYELPDGKTIDVGTERFKTCELMFNPSLLEADKCSIFGVASPSEVSSLHESIVECVGKCDTDIRKDLYGNVIVTGGNTLFPMFKERLEKELVEAVSMVKVKVIMPMATTERKFSVWIGGSILASLGSFQQMWISKKQYGEEGAQVVHTQCP